MNDLNKQGAIWFPIFSREAAFWIAGIFALFISGLVIFLPPVATSAQAERWFNFMIAIPDVAYRVSLSEIPFTLAISYGFVLILAPLLACIFCCTKLNISRSLPQLKKKKASYRVLMTISFFLLMIIPYFVPVTIAPGHLGYRNLIAISNNRFWLFFFSNIAVLGFACFWFGIVIEIKNFISYLMGDRHGSNHA